MIPSPYIILAFEMQPGSEIVATMRQADETASARPQVIDRDYNLPYDMLSRFAKSTGLGGLPNPSSNLHGYPVAEDERGSGGLQEFRARILGTRTLLPSHEELAVIRSGARST